MAKEHKVAYHKWYIVSGPVGGKVTNANGTVTYCTIPEGGEGCFYAVSTKVYTDNAAVQVDEIVNFNGALVASAGSGSGGALLSGSNTFTGANVFVNDFSVLPLGHTTVLGAPAYGLHVSASGGLQLFGTHFMLSDKWSDHSLKVVNDTVCLTSTAEAAIGFDYANKVVFRTMPNDGDSANDGVGAVYEFQGWRWADDSHTDILPTGVDLRKETASLIELGRTSVLNRSEGDARWARGHLIAASPNIYTYDAARVSASYDNSLSVGGMAYCQRNDATAVGIEARTLNTGGIALGRKSYSTAIDALAIGAFSNASGQNAIALGRDANVQARNSIAIGYKIKASKQAAISVGYQSTATGLYSTAVGYKCQSTAQETYEAYYGGVTFGQSCTASGPGGVALGHGCTASAKHATVLGQWSAAKGVESLVLGGYSEASGTGGNVIGFKSKSTVNYGTAIGYAAEVGDVGCTVVAAWNTAVNMRTQLYLIGAGSALAEKYYATPSGAVATNGCLAFVTKNTDGTVVATGMKKLTDLLTDNVYNAETGEGFVATLGLDDEPAPMPFLPEDGFAPIDTEAPVMAMVEGEEDLTEENNEQ